MSLFSSAFETGISAGPSKPLTFGGSTASPASGGGGKRKRRSSLTGGSSGGGKDDQLRATQVNLEKLMGKLDRGEVKEKVGRESVGDMGKKKGKGKAGNNSNSNNKPQNVAEPSPRPKTAPKPAKKAKHDTHADPKGQQSEKKGPQGGKKGQQSEKKGPQPKAGGKKGDATTTATPAANTTKNKSNDKKTKPAPVELPLPAMPKEKGAADGLTDMQRSMKAKLEGARFRWINEQLYTVPSTDAVAMMKEDPKIFADYHQTHRTLTAHWPQPPLEHITALLTPLPKGTVIADLGCGDAGLARALVPQGKIVLSYDLVGDSGAGIVTTSGVGKGGWVVEADFLSHVPLPGRTGGNEHTLPTPTAEPATGKKKKRDAAASEIVDHVVCCLSLMGTNWLGGVYEAARILKQGGSLHVAEVTSRFVDVDEFVAAVESFGLKLEEKDEPSTHFTLFRFGKWAPVPQGPARGEEGWEERIAAGEDILRACVYKKR